MKFKILIILLIGILLFGGCIQRPEPIQQPTGIQSPVSICANWTLLKEDSFEYEKTFTFPEKWGSPPDTPGSHYELEWYPETAVAHAETSSKIAKTGEKSAHIWNTPSERSVLLAPTFREENILTGKRAIETWFYLDECWTDPWSGVWLTIDQYICSNETDRSFKIRIIGIGINGYIFYGQGYTPNLLKDPALKHFNGNFRLSPKVWYWARLETDFSRKEGYLSIRGEDGLKKDFYIPDMDQREGNESLIWKYINFSFSAHYIGVSHLPKTHSKHAYFDDARLYICSI